METLWIASWSPARSVSSLQGRTTDKTSSTSPRVPRIQLSDRRQMPTVDVESGSIVTSRLLAGNPTVGHLGQNRRFEDC
jgi:hypothetical protein